MIRKILTGLSLVGFLTAVVPAMAHKTSTQESQGKQQATKSITGKVASIGDQGKSFALEVNDGSSNRTTSFVVDKTTQVQGRVTEGTIVAVEYQPSGDGQNLCVRITAQG